MQARDCTAPDLASGVQRLLHDLPFTRNQQSSSAEAVEPSGQARWRRLMEDKWTTPRCHDLHVALPKNGSGRSIEKWVLTSGFGHGYLVAGETMLVGGVLTASD